MAALSFLFLSPPSSSATVGASYAGCGSSRRSESLFAAPAARSDHLEGASRFRGAGACSAQWSPTSSSSGHVADLSLMVLRRTQVRLWALACAQAAKPPVPTPGLHLQQQRAARGGCWWYVACGLRTCGMRGCGLLYEVVRLFLPIFDVAPLSLRLAKTDSFVQEAAMHCRHRAPRDRPA